MVSNKVCGGCALRMAVGFTVLILLILSGGAYALDGSGGGVEVRGSVVSVPGSLSDFTPHSWNASNFAGFWYDLEDNLQTETLQVLSVNNRIIYGTSRSEQLVYQTYKTQKTLKVVENGKVNVTDAGINMFDNGNYGILGWQGAPFIAVKGNAKKLVKLVIEQSNAYFDKKSLTVGETWDIGDGWTLTAQSIDAKVTPRQAWLVLSKDGVKKDDKVIGQGSAYVYVEKSFAGESDVPLFVTYADSVFAGAIMIRFESVFSGTEVQAAFLKGVFQISDNSTSVKTGDQYNDMKVTAVGQDKILMSNNNDISLDNGRIEQLMGNIKLKVGDTSATDNALRFYFTIAGC